ncbi:c-type cytochrome biogenesis protein CcmI [Thauera sinica]|uniref:C-type cytochrome biogenesis protein CcmI n=1 Tax=Thauera sinica TaxID=2665146 RepID=A0ABW1AN53_9RHOO|nr:c-type cytochrome biogenesis protein CcmI [Thauera sp. K11]ATE61774.1 c-type cytochrome biogenesis protein CcmI [Thauera sp. K11]
MITFIVLAGLLVAGALLLVLPPLLRARGRDEAEPEQAAIALKVLREQLAELDADLAAGRLDAATHAQARDELERRALEEGEASAASVAAAEAKPAKRWALALALGVPAMAAVAYVALGNPDGLDPAKVAGRQGFSQAEIADMVGKLAARLEQEPDNVEGWLMLARSYAVLQDYDKAARTYERVAKLAPGEPDVYADWADVVAARMGSVAGEAEALAQKALDLAPEHPKALALAGTAAYQRKDFAAAAAHWEKILARIPPGDDLARGVRASIDDAREKAGLPPLAEAPAAAAPSAHPSSALTLSGRVDIDAALRDELAPDDTVFVFVRGEGGGPPLAALRFRGNELPRDFSFDGVPLMTGDASVPVRVAVAARVSKSGNVTAAAGDLEGRLSGVAPDASGLKLTIDTRH